VRFAYLLLLSDRACILVRSHQPHCGVYTTSILQGRFDQKLDSEDDVGFGRGISEAHLHVGEARGLSMELPGQELDPCESILARGSNEG
jgi:hypothetical protein